MKTILGMKMDFLSFAAIFINTTATATDAASPKTTAIMGRAVILIVSRPGRRAC